MSVCKNQTTALINSLANNNDTKLAFIESEMTFLNTYNGTLISKLSKENKGVTMKVIMYLLERLNDQFNMNLKLNRVQLVTISFDLLNKLKNETLEDVVLLFRMARLGELGGKLHRLDSHVIFNEWIPIYMEMKSIKREDLIREKREKNKIDLNSKESWSKESKEKINSLINSFTKKDETKKIKRADMSNNDSFIESMKVDLISMNLEELNNFKKHCEHRSYKNYANIIQEELDKRNT